jgi:hypothetical protein
MSMRRAFMCISRRTPERRREDPPFITARQAAIAITCARGPLASAGAWSMHRHVHIDTNRGQSGRRDLAGIHSSHMRQAAVDEPSSNAPHKQTPNKVGGKPARCCPPMHMATRAPCATPCAWREERPNPCRSQRRQTAVDEPACSMVHKQAHFKKIPTPHPLAANKSLHNALIFYK